MRSREKLDIKGIKRFINKGEYKKAKKILESLISTYPEWVTPYILLSYILEKNNKDEALKILLDVEHIEPFNQILKRKIARLHLECGHRGSAREMAEELSLFFPDRWLEGFMERLKSPFITETMAKLYERQGYKEDARGIYDKLVKI